MYQFNFERLEVWKKSRILTRDIYFSTKSFPSSEKYGIVNQIRRSAVSICSNIAEGAGRLSPKDQKHFYNIAYSSLMECFNQILIADDLEYLESKTVESFRKDINTISFMLIKLRDSI